MADAKNDSASVGSAATVFVTSTTASTPSSAASRPSPVLRSTPVERDTGTTTWPPCCKALTVGVPTRPVAPTTAIRIARRPL